MLILQATTAEARWIGLQTIDWVIIGLYMLISIVIGVIYFARASKSTEEYFKSGGGVTWWLLGTSMVATTFAADTPLVLAGWVVTKGIAQNWYWWSMVPITMLGVFFFARLWKRANPLTDMEFVYTRYSGKPAHALRMGKAIWLALPYGCLVMGWVNKAMAVIIGLVVPNFPRIPILDGLTLFLFLHTPLSSGVHEGILDAVKHGQIDPIEIGTKYNILARPILWNEFSEGVYEERTDDRGVFHPNQHQVVLDRLGLGQTIRLDTLADIEGVDPSLYTETAPPPAATTPSQTTAEIARMVRPVELGDGSIVDYALIEGRNARNEHTLAEGRRLLSQEVEASRAKAAPLAGLDSAEFLHGIYQICSGVNQYKILFTLFVITIVYTAISGLWGVLVTDFFQFWLAMFGCVMLAIFAVQYCGGMEEMLTRMAGIYGLETARAMTSIMPTRESGGLGMVSWTEWALFIGIFWWAYGFTDGGSYFAQRMLSAKDERHAALGYLWYAVAHYALRMWPWLIVGFAAAVTFPHLAYPSGAMPTQAIAEQGYVKMMLEVLGPGWLGLLMAALLAAYMSTIATQVNIAASYLLNDVYRPFIAPLIERRVQRRTGNTAFRFSEKHYVRCSIGTTVFIALAGIVVSLMLSAIANAWFLLAGFNAGIGVIYLLRWYWWRINAWTEMTCLLALLFSTIAFKILGTKIAGANLTLPFNLLVTVPFSVGLAFIVTAMTQPTDRDKLKDFYRKVQPGGPGWREIEAEIKAEDPSFVAQSPLVWSNFRNWLLSIACIYLWLVGIGKVVIGQTLEPVLSGAEVHLELLLLGAFLAALLRGLIGPAFKWLYFVAVVVGFDIVISLTVSPAGRLPQEVPFGFLFLSRFVGAQMLILGTICGWVVAKSFSHTRWSAGVSGNPGTVS